MDRRCKAIVLISTIVLGHAAVVLPGGIMRTIGSSTYAANAAVFDGSDRLERDAGFTGAADGLTFSLSCWIDPTAGDATFTFIIANNGYGVLMKLADNTIRVTANGTDADEKIRLNQDTGKVAAITAASGWTWICASGSNATGGGASHLYIANASTSWVATEALSGTSFADQDNVNLDFTQTDWCVGDYPGGSNPYTGELCEPWYDITRKIDWSSGTEQAKFYVVVGTGKPTDLTGIYTPILWLKSAAASYTVNSGSGGNLTAYGGGVTPGTPP